MARLSLIPSPDTKTMPSLSEAAGVLLTYIRQNDYVTYAEMRKVLAPYIPIEGPLASEIRSCPNLIIWTGMSQEWMDVLHELFTANLICHVPSCVLTYLIDGMTLTFPVAHRPPRGGYKTPHWAPVCLRPIEKVPERQKSQGSRKHAS